MFCQICNISILFFLAHWHKIILVPKFIVFTKFLRPEHSYNTNHRTMYFLPWIRLRLIIHERFRRKFIP